MKKLIYTITIILFCGALAIANNKTNKLENQIESINNNAVIQAAAVFISRLFTSLFFMLLKRSYSALSLLNQFLELLIYLYIAFYLYTTILLILIESNQKHVGQASDFN